MKLTANERAYVDLRKEIRRQDSIEAERMASQQLWRDVDSSEWCREAAQARKKAEELRRASELEQRRQWQSRQAEAVAESFIELDIH